MPETDEADDERPYECELCDDSFRTEAELEDHVWEYHEMDGDVPP
ncbi:hypothetical protein [Haloarchaeobius baliensis]